MSVADVKPALAGAEARPGRRDAPALAIAWGGWAALVTAALFYVARYGSNVPSWDDWDMVPTVTGVQPVTLDWLWSQHNEHRIPVPRLVMLALAAVFGFDFRVWMVGNVVLMAAVSAGFLLALRRLRGRTSVTDVFVPIVLLNWGQGLNFIWGWQLEFFVSTALAAAVLLAFLAIGRRVPLRVSLLVAALMALLGGTGAHGVALLPALGAWAGGTAILRWRDRAPRQEVAALVTAAVTAGGMCVAYLIGYEAVPHHPQNLDLLRSVVTVSQALTMSFGPAVRAAWPVSGVLMIALLLATAALVCRVVWSGADRWRGLALLGFAASIVMLAGALGLGRDGFEPRYITLLVPVLIVTYVAWALYGGRPGVVVCAAMCLTAAILLLPNAAAGIAYGRNLRAELGAVERAIREGEPPYRIIARHHLYLARSHGLLLDYMDLLRQARVGAFADLRPNPPMREIDVRLEPIAEERARVEGRTIYGEGYGSSVVFDLGVERHVAGVRIRYTHRNARGWPPHLFLFWKAADEAEFSKDRSVDISPTGDRMSWEHGAWTRRSQTVGEALFWIDAPMQQIKVIPDGLAGHLEVLEFVLLVPDDDAVEASTRRE